MASSLFSPNPANAGKHTAAALKERQDARRAEDAAKAAKQSGKK